MNYRKTFQVGEPKSALVEVTTKLKEIGFKSRDGNDHYVKMTGPRFVDTKKSPLTAISLIEIRVTDRALRVAANVDKAIKLFLIILACVFVPMFFAAPFVPNNTMWFVLAGNLALWAVLLPLINLAFKAKAAAALEDLMEGL